MNEELVLSEELALSERKTHEKASMAGRYEIIMQRHTPFSNLYTLTPPIADLSNTESHTLTMSSQDEAAEVYRDLLALTISQ